MNGNGTTSGAVWSFTTEPVPGPPGAASNPLPADEATGVSIDVVLSWTAGSGAASHDVYFGTNPTPEFLGNQGPIRLIQELWLLMPLTTGQSMR